MDYSRSHLELNNPLKSYSTVLDANVRRDSCGCREQSMRYSPVIFFYRDAPCTKAPQENEDYQNLDDEVMCLMRKQTSCCYVMILKKLFNLNTFCSWAHRSDQKYNNRLRWELHKLIIFDIVILLVIFIINNDTIYFQTVWLSITGTLFAGWWAKVVKTLKPLCWKIRSNIKFNALSYLN